MSEEFPTDHGAKPPGDRSKDLFGEPASPYRDPLGRKKLKRTNDLSYKVAVLRAAGMDRQQIADAIGCCKKTLETLFFTIAERRHGSQAGRGACAPIGAPPHRRKVGGVRAARNTPPSDRARRNAL